MKIGFAPSPYKGETLYRWATRYAKYAICKSETKAVIELFGDKRYTKGLGI